MKLSRASKIVLATFAVGFIAIRISSGEGKGPIATQFELFDKDHDGKLSAEEIKPAPWAALLIGADNDKDGSVTLEEVRDHFSKDAALILKTELSTPEKMLKRFEQTDADHDGFLTKAELGKNDWLMRMDRDEDGKLSLAEIKLSLARQAKNDPPPSATPPPTYEAAPSAMKAPKAVNAGEFHIGTRIALEPAASAKVTVIALVSPSCPIGKRYLPELARLEKAWPTKDVQFRFVCPNPTDELKDTGLSGTIQQKEIEPLLATLKATHTTDVFVLDAAQTLVYRGAISDQYGLGYSKDAPSHTYLKDAVEATLAGKSPAIAATEAPGCTLDLSGKLESSLANVTYHNRISRVLQSNCLECHHAGGIAPFALETFEQVKAKAGMIRQVISDKLMPPWFASDTTSGRHAIWKNDRTLAEMDRTDLLAWLGNGKPEGDAKDAPLPKVWPNDWKIGTPDAVYQVPNAIDVKAEGIMPYQNVWIDTNTTEDKWVQAWEVQPSAREVVHHIIVFVEKSTQEGGKKRRNESFLAAFVPGNSFVDYGPERGKFVPAGARLHFQIHYTPNGKAVKDQARVGLTFCKQKPNQVVEVVGIANGKLSIPANEPNHPVTATIPVPAEVQLVGLMPHMHFRGKSFRYELTLPNGDVKSLLDIPRYDFNWQLAYRFQQPPTIPAGSKIRAIGWFDNSKNNPANPDPNRVVTWGEQTTDEMMIGYVEFVKTEPAPIPAGS